MICRHVEMIHAICPVDPAVFDYYEVAFESDALILVEVIRDALLIVRGQCMYQEQITQQLADDCKCTVVSAGSHGTTRSTVTATPR